MQTPQKIAVVGSGLVGTLLGIYLKRRGHTVHIYDRSPDIRKTDSRCLIGKRSEVSERT